MFPATPDSVSPFPKCKDDGGRGLEMTVSGMQAAGLGLRLAGLGSDLGQNLEVECHAHLRFLLAWWDGGGGCPTRCSASPWLPGGHVTQLKPMESSLQTRGVPAWQSRREGIPFPGSAQSVYILLAGESPATLTILRNLCLPT